MFSSVFPFNNLYYLIKLMPTDYKAFFNLINKLFITTFLTN